MNPSAPAASSTAPAFPPAVLADYLSLVTRHPLVAISDDEGHARAIAVLNEIIDIPEPTPGQEMYLDALGDLVHSYESRIDPEPVVSPADLLRFLMESASVTQKQVSDGTGLSQPTISDLICGRRPASRKAAKALGEFFKVDPSAFF